MKLTRLMAAALLMLAMLALPARAADQFPSRLITLVVPLTPGTTIDILARLYADKLSQFLGQQIVVLNKPGAGGVIGGETVANATPDGYTLLFANSGHSILGFINKSMPFDPIHDFAGVVDGRRRAGDRRRAGALGVTNLKEFIDLAKAKPGQLNYGSAGIGTSTHLAGAYFAAQTKIDLVHVPYTVSTNIISDMLSGAIQASFDPLAFVLSFLQNGSLRGLAVGADDADRRSGANTDGDLARRRLPLRHLVRHLGAGENAETGAEEARRRHRQGEPGSRPGAKDQSARHPAGKYRCWTRSIPTSIRRRTARAADQRDRRQAIKPVPRSRHARSRHGTTSSCSARCRSKCARRRARYRAPAWSMPMATARHGSMPPRFLVCKAGPMGLIAPGENGTVCPVEGPLPDGVLGEVRVHQQIYQRRAATGAVCRVIPPQVMAMSVLGRPPKARHGFGAFFYPSPAFWNDPTLMRSDAIAAAVADRLGDANGIILRGNGAVVAGVDIKQAVTLMLVSRRYVPGGACRAGGGRSRPRAAPHRSRGPTSRRLGGSGGRTDVVLPDLWRS